MECKVRPSTLEPEPTATIQPLVGTVGVVS